MAVEGGLGVGVEHLGVGVGWLDNGVVGGGDGDCGGNCGDNCGALVGSNGRCGASLIGPGVVGEPSRWGEVLARGAMGNINVGSPTTPGPMRVMRKRKMKLPMIMKMIAG